MNINWNSSGGGECKTKNIPWGAYGYFLEVHNVSTVYFTDHNLHYKVPWHGW